MEESPEPAPPPGPTSGGIWTIVVAAGSGTRFGAPKQFETLGDRRVVDWSIAAARAAGTGVVLVVPPGHASRNEPGVDAVVVGRATRSGSVRAGLEAVPSEATTIVVHDAARPAATPELFSAVIEAVVGGGPDAAVPGVALVDSVRRRDGAAIDRDELVAVQTPQAFRADALRQAHANGEDATDDATLVERAGGRVVVVEGDPDNVKLTRPADIDRLARAIGLAGTEPAARSAG